MWTTFIHFLFISWHILYLIWQNSHQTDWFLHLVPQASSSDQSHTLGQPLDYQISRSETRMGHGQRNFLYSLIIQKFLRKVWLKKQLIESSHKVLSISAMLGSICRTMIEGKYLYYFAAGKVHNLKVCNYSRIPPHSCFTNNMCGIAIEGLFLSWKKCQS